jgi:YHS domain-containing protein
MRLAVNVLAACLTMSAGGALAQGVADRWDPATQAKPVPPALGGFCLVSLRDRQQWQPGDEQHSVFFDGRRYQFASARERDIFAAAPEAYVPTLGGDCPVTLADTGRRQRGSLEFGVLHGGRLMFFASEDDRQYFLEDPSQFANVDLALGGRCIVSQRDSGKKVAGIAETVAVYRGMRYFFASAHDRSLFLKYPLRYDGSASGEGAPPETPVAEDSAKDAPIAAAAPWTGANKQQNDDAHRRSNEEDIILSSLPVMMGYCPVTLVRDGAWVRGRYDYRVELGDHVFLTAGARERDALQAAPAAYVPALAGDCVVTYIARGERVRGSVYHAFEYDGRMFLFADAERKAVFKASPEKYAAADWAAAGMCVVTRSEEGRDVMGGAEHATWHHGKLYRFSGAEQLTRFLATPEEFAEQPPHAGEPPRP